MLIRWINGRPAVVSPQSTSICIQINNICNIYIVKWSGSSKQNEIIIINTMW